jgi:hypothetical protein
MTKAARFLRALCCVAALSTPAFASSDDSDVSITQAGATPRPGGNVSVIVQRGSDNYAESDQTGALNSDAIEQFGNNNSATVRQQGIGGVVVDIQLGNGNIFSVTQTGINPPPVILVQRR